MLGIGRNINSKGTAHVQAPKQDFANRTGSLIHVFLARHRPASAAGASEENFSDLVDVHLENSVHVPPQENSRAARILRYPLRSSEEVEANTFGTSRGVKTRTPRRRQVGLTHPLGPSSTPQGGLSVTLSVYSKHIN